jgi:hypothetical protein
MKQGHEFPAVPHQTISVSNMMLEQKAFIRNRNFYLIWTQRRQWVWAFMLTFFWTVFQDHIAKMLGRIDRTFDNVFALIHFQLLTILIDILKGLFMLQSIGWVAQ